VWWKIGRKPKADSVSTMLTVDIQDREKVVTLDQIAARENKTRSDILRMIIDEGIKIHQPGNPQLTINSFIDGEHNSLVELEARVRVFYLNYKGSEINLQMILASLKADNVDPKLRKNMAENIANWLGSQGRTIYR